MHTLRQYLSTLSDPHGLTRTLDQIEVCRDEQGKMCYTAGNSAVVFRIRHQGMIRSLRCYTRPTPHLREIYGERFLPRELYLYTSPSEGEWVDVVLGDWIEGITLHDAIRQAAAEGDAGRLKTLAVTFASFAAALLTDNRAHGDLKPENLILTPEGRLEEIDFDAVYLSSFAGHPSPELGTAAYQHPARTAADFDSSLDDYPAALICTALYALSLDASLLDRHPSDGVLFTPSKIAVDPALQEVLSLFETHGLALQYRIAKLLHSPSLRLPELADLLARLADNTPPTTETPELYAENGLWGYRTADRIVIPPLYNCGFDFTEGLAAVRLGQSWHYIDTAGRTRLSCPGCEAVKPFRDGYAVVIRSGERRRIDNCGNEFAI